VRGFALLLLVSLSAAGEGDYGRALVERVRDVSTESEAIRDIDVTAKLDADGNRISIRILYKAPSHFALYMRDGHDGTPLFLFSRKKVLIYDPSRSEAVYCENAAMNFLMAVRDGEF
jgi:hypothetical protein